MGILTCALVLTARFCLSFANSVALSFRGRRESRAPAAPAIHRVRCVAKENAHGFDRYSQDIPAFPAQWVDGLYAVAPVSGVDCHRCRPKQSGRIDATVAAPGPCDFAVRSPRLVGERSPDAASVHRNPHRRNVTTRFAPSWRHGLGRLIRLAVYSVKPNIFAARA